jgi:hypothetical protein
LKVFFSALVLLGVLLSVQREAQAGAGKLFFETLGVGIAVGSVLGASTLPFYDQPGTHLINLVYGASAGAVAGIGYFFYNLATAPSREGFYEAELRRPPSRATAGPEILALANASPGVRGQSAFPLSSNSYPRFWTPLVSLNW